MVNLPVGLTTPIPILPVVVLIIEGFPVIVLYSPVPKSIPPIFNEFAVALGSEIFVPIIILFAPTLFPVNELPALNPKKLQNKAGLDYSCY